MNRKTIGQKIDDAVPNSFTSAAQSSSRYWNHALMAALGITSGLLLLLELRFPYYFLQDDGCNYFLPSFFHNWREVLQEHFPAYNFHTFAGVPHEAVSQPGVFYIPQYLAMGLSEGIWKNPFAALDIMAWMHILIAVAGGYVLLRYLKVSDTAAVFGALTAMSGFVLWAGRMWPFVLMLGAWFPWMIWSALRYLDQPGLKRGGIMLVIHLALLYGGYPQFFVLAVLFEYGFTLCYIASKPPPRGRRVYLSYLLWLLPTAFIGMPMLLPVWAQTLISLQRARPLLYEVFSALHLSPYQWFVGQFCPFIPWPARTGHISGALPYLSYIGFLPALLPLGAARLWRKNTRLRPYLLASGIGFAAAFLWATNLIGPLIYLIPVLNRFRWPFKLIYFAGFFECLIAALALSQFSRRRQMTVLAVAIANGIAIFGFTPNHAWRIRKYPVPISTPWRASLRHGRYAMIAPTNFFHSNQQYEGFNFSELWGQDNLLGYEPMLSFRQAVTEASGHIYNGSIHAPLTAVMLGHFQLWSVKYILLSPRRNQYVSRLRAAGYQKIKTRQGWTLWQNPRALPRARWQRAAGAKPDAQGLRWAERGNTIQIHITQWPGKVLTLAFANNPGFASCIAGQCQPIPNAPDGMVHITIPPGTRSVDLVYKTPYLRLSWQIALGTLLIYLGLLWREHRMGRLRQKLLTEPAGSTIES